MDPIPGFAAGKFDGAVRVHVNMHSSRIPNINKIDEGFSEANNDESASETLCTPEAIEIEDPVDIVAQSASVRNWLLTQPVELRCELARVLLASLPTPTLSSLVKEANARLHFDPALVFPPEIFFHTLKYLTPADQVRASYVSKAWRTRAMDVTLWRRLFALEGWTSNSRMIRMLESTAQTQVRRFCTPATLSGIEQQVLLASSRQDGQGPRPPRTRLWVRDGTFQIPTSLYETSAGLYSLQGIRRQSLEYLQGPDPMEDVAMSEPGPDKALAPSAATLDGIFCPLLEPSRLIDTAQQLPRPNWHYLFSQRQRLEQNWSAGLFKNFRLPKEEYDHEKHRECIYTLQFSSKHVVSGSRDKTIRVWDLEEQRLKIPPLCGHKASVLCLQFDESPEQDVIVSGGSDAAVVFWKFSTGAQLKQIKKAHSQAVLNLRFDKRYLVTCSKDNAIKVWSMKDLATSDPDYPQTNKSIDATYPDYVLDINELVANASLRTPPSIPKFTLLMTLNGHSAAVNAIQMLGDEIVSASGDRKVMLWHLPSGTLRRTFYGHTKGIACVQYDGRRIISGSSDETVRVFDAETAAEMSLLTGHRDLVRTIQADFGDVPGEELREEAEARAHSNQMLENKRKRLFGEIAPATKDELFVIGAKLPPGGGGNRWSKIVSGSYDETVIIWRQDKNGRWMIMKELRQEDAMKATTTQRVAATSRVPIIPPAVLRPTGTGPPTSVFQQVWNGLPLSSSPSVFQQALNGLPLSSSSSQTPTPPQLRNIQRQAAMQTAQPWLGTRRLSNGQWLQPQIPSNILDPPVSSSTAMNVDPPSTSARPSLAALQQQAAAQTANTLAASPPSDFPPTPPTNSDAQPNVNNLSQVPAHTPAHHHPNHPHFNQNPWQPAAQFHVQAQPGNVRELPAEVNTSRLFKLQFDSRRIICCSQQPIIVGWDFANGDKDIIEASQFFGETS